MYPFLIVYSFIKDFIMEMVNEKVTRRRRNCGRILQLLNKFEDAGVTVKEFCKTQQINQGNLSPPFLHAFSAYAGLIHQKVVKASCGMGVKQ